MLRSSHRLLAPGLAVASVALTGALTGVASPAHAGGGGGGDDDAAVIAVTERATRLLLAGRNRVTGTGPAEVRRVDDQLYLGLPVRGDSDDRSARGGDDDDDSDDDSDVTALRGGIAFVGAGPDIVWRALRANTDRDVITAVSGGKRIGVLRAADRDDSDDRAARGGGDDDALVLTPAGARQLNRAAAGAPFRAGQVFAGDSENCV